MRGWWGTCGAAANGRNVAQLHDATGALPPEAGQDALPPDAG